MEKAGRLELYEIILGSKPFSKEKEKPSTKYELIPDKRLDLRGKQCPMTFVYTKVALEEMKEKQILQVTLDFKAAFTNVPKSVKKQKLGTVLHQAQKEDICHLYIQKK